MYVGNLDPKTTKEQLDDAFRPVGKLKNVWVARRPPGFAFVEYEDPRDAEDAVTKLNDTELDGRRIRVEVSGARGDRRGRDRDRDRERSPRDRSRDRSPRNRSPRAGDGDRKPDEPKARDGDDA